jgi:F-type H+-transporting ATPase subunit a
MHIEISLVAEPLFYIGAHTFTIAGRTFTVGGFAFTNSMLTSVLVGLALIIGSLVLYRRWSLVPGRFQSMVEMGIDFVLNLCVGTAGEKMGRRIFPLVGTFFIFILMANWGGLLPGYGAITVRNFEGHVVSLLRPANADLNTTVAMALVSIACVQVLGISARGVLGYVKEFFEPISFMSVILFPVHVIGEVSHVISLSVRLFGNIFAGEALSIVMYVLLPYVVPFVFLGLEMLFGFIQAMIFTVLSIGYVALATAKHD